MQHGPRVLHPFPTRRSSDLEQRDDLARLDAERHVIERHRAPEGTRQIAHIDHETSICGDALAFGRGPRVLVAWSCRLRARPLLRARGALGDRPGLARPGTG